MMAPTATKWCVMILMILGLLCYCLPQSPVAKTPSMSQSDQQKYQAILEPWELLPFEGDVVHPISRPEVPMSISSEIYDHVRLFIDGKEIEKGPITLKSGAPIDVKVLIFPNTKLPNDVMLSGGLGVACKARNREGWIFSHPKFFKSTTSTNRICDCHGDWVAPEEPGEYELLVLSTAGIMSMETDPCRIAYSVPLTIESISDAR